MAFAHNLVAMMHVLTTFGFLGLRLYALKFQSLSQGNLQFEYLPMEKSLKSIYTIPKLH